MEAVSVDAFFLGGMVFTSVDAVQGRGGTNDGLLHDDATSLLCRYEA